jgi:hypothetical protein
LRRCKTLLVGCQIGTAAASVRAAGLLDQGTGEWRSV